MTAACPSESPRIVVAGVGLITPLGQSAWQTFAALLQGRRLTDRVDGLETNTQPVPLAQALGGVSIARHTATDPTVELAERAAREALTEAGLSLRPKSPGPLPGAGALPGALPGGGVPTWLGTSKGAVAAMSDLGCMLSATGEKQIPRRLLEAVALGPHGYLSHHLTARLPLDIRRHTVAACASSLTALHQARLALQHQPSPTTRQPSPFALVLTAEAALLPAFIHSYQRLGVLAPMNLDDYRQAPLDASRRGFVLSEVGAAVLLKRLAPGEPVPAGAVELVDTAIATEAADLIRPSSNMEALSHVAEHLFRDSGDRGRHIAALHPHAPGTADHDPTELRILAQAWRSSPQASPRKPQTPPAVYANKGSLGHSLGSAGLVSFVIACLAARTGKLPPMPWLDNPLPDAPLPLTATPALDRHAGGTHGIFAAGFGGHVAGALLQRSE